MPVIDFWCLLCRTKAKTLWRYKNVQYGLCETCDQKKDSHLLAQNEIDKEYPNGAPEGGALWFNQPFNQPK